MERAPPRPTRSLNTPIDSRPQSNSQSRENQEINDIRGSGERTFPPTTPVFPSLLGFWSHEFGVENEFYTSNFSPNNSDYPIPRFPFPIYRRPFALPYIFVECENPTSGSFGPWRACCPHWFFFRWYWVPYRSPSIPCGPAH